MDNKANKYFAFISYQREDEEWAIWFHHELENYHLPTTLNGRTDLPSEFRPVFRDIDELKAGNLPEQIHNALDSSTYLIVICSPNSAKSEWVNKELSDFIEIGKAKSIDNIRNIFPFIVKGSPHSKNEFEECFPGVLLGLHDKDERIGGNVNESGRDKAFIKVMAGMLGNVSFDDLWNRYEHDKAEEERLKREERDRFLRIQSRLVSEKVINITNDSYLAQCLALEVLPYKINNPDRPFTIEAERALRQATFQHCVTMRGHTHSVNGISFSSDGKIIASVSDDFTIRIWNADTGSLIKILDTGHPLGHCVSFASDDEILIAVFGDGALVVWDVKTWECLTTLDFNQVFKTNHSASSISSMAISLDGNRIALSTLEGDIFLLDFNTEETLSIEIEPVISVAFSSDGKRLVSMSYGGLNVWDLEEGSRGDYSIKEVVEPEFANAQFNLEGTEIAFVFDNTIGIIDVAEDGRAQTFKDGESRYVSIAFCNDGKYLASISECGISIVWDAQTHTAIFKGCRVSGEIDHAVFSKKGDLVGMVVDKKSIVVQKVFPDVFCNFMIEKDNPVESISFSPDKKHLVTSSMACEDDELKIWDIDTGRIIHKLKGHTDYVAEVSYSPDGSLIASASGDGTIRIWDSAKNETIKVLTDTSAENGQTAFTSVLFNPKEKQVAATLYNGEIVVWDLYSGTVVSKMTHGNCIKSIDYSQDGKKIISGSINQDVKVWDASEGKLEMTLKGHTGIINSVKYSTDGKHIVSASEDKSIICWDAETGKIEWQTRGFDGKICCLAFSNDGRQLVATTCDWEKPIVVCDSLTGEILVAYNGLPAPANAVSCRPDGEGFATVGPDGAIYLWKFPNVQELIDNARERYKDYPLSSEERKQYYLE